MKTNTVSSSRRRRDIVAEIGQVPVIISGTLTTRERNRGGGVAVYHQLQRWRDGSNDTRHIPARRLQVIQDGVEGYKKVQALIEEMAQLDENDVLASVQCDSKKNSTKR